MRYIKKSIKKTKKTYIKKTKKTKKSKKFKKKGGFIGIFSKKKTELSRENINLLKSHLKNNFNKFKNFLKYNIDEFCAEINLIAHHSTQYVYQKDYGQYSNPTILKKIVVENNNFSDLIFYFFKKEDFITCKNYLIPLIEENENDILLLDKLATYGIEFLEESSNNDPNDKIYKLKLRLEPDADANLYALKNALEESLIMNLFNDKSRRRDKNDYVLTLSSYLNNQKIEVEKIKKKIANEINNLLNNLTIVYNLHDF